jgi:hypothetical protein
MNLESKKVIEYFERTQPFVEHVGTLKQFEITGQCITIFLAFTSQRESKIILTISSPEAKSLTRQLRKLLGKRIGILKTGDPLHPFRFRVIDREE